MSRDYLGRLAARTLGVGDFVRPRLASRFEGGRPPIGEQDVEIEPPRTAAETPVAARAVAPPAAAPPDEGHRLPIGVGHSQTVVAERDPDPTAERSRPRAAAGTSLEGVHLSARRVEVDDNADRVMARRPPAAPPDVPEDRAPSAATPPAHTPDDVVGRATAGEPTRRERVETVHREVVHPASVALPEIVPAMSRRDAARASSEPAGEPTIHVTIGRIEVRAAQPASPPPRPRRPAPPTMTLTDYLRRRSEG